MSAARPILRLRNFGLPGAMHEFWSRNFMVKRFVRKVFFRVKQIYVANTLCSLRKAYWRLQGMRIGRDVRFSSLDITWPHKVSLGNRCSLEHGIYLNAAGPYSEGISIELGEGCFIGTGCEFNITSRVTIGKCSLIAAGTRFIDHNHGTVCETCMKEQPDISAPIRVGDDVWIGANSIILRGVTIGDGAIVAAGSVVTRSVAAYTVGAGCPSRPQRDRRELSGAGAQLVKTAPKLNQDIPEIAAMIASSERSESAAARARKQARVQGQSRIKQQARV